MVEHVEVLVEEVTGADPLGTSGGDPGRNQVFGIEPQLADPRDRGADLPGEHRVPTARCTASGHAPAPRPASNSRTRNSCSGAVSSRGSGSPGAAARRSSHRQNACIVVTQGGLTVRFIALATRLRTWLAERRAKVSTSGCGPFADRSPSSSAAAAATTVVLPDPGGPITSAGPCRRSWTAVCCDASRLQPWSAVRLGPCRPCNHLAPTLPARRHASGQSFDQITPGLRWQRRRAM